ncbi:hypothetical protein [Pontibacter rugosus]|uniref:Lipopolysaccharide assembly protein A domain-containing protein n=1 Tax=Pontibacter rugosus TaxID=1745966 RepID=A0ABW3SMF4_9BACT
MKTLQGLLDVIVFAYIIFTVLLLAGIIDANSFLNISSDDKALTLYQLLIAAGGVIMLARVLVSNLYIANLKHDRHRAELKINGLKAELYEKRQAFRSNIQAEKALQQEEVSQ